MGTIPKPPARPPDEVPWPKPPPPPAAGAASCRTLPT